MLTQAAIQKNLHFQPAANGGQSAPSSSAINNLSMEDVEGNVFHIFGGHYILEWLFQLKVFSGFQSTHNQHLDSNIDIHALHDVTIAALMVSSPLLPLCFCILASYSYPFDETQDNNMSQALC